MSITFELEVGSEAFAAYLAVNRRLQPGELHQRCGIGIAEELCACVHRLLQVVNSDGVRAHAITEGGEAPRWLEAARTDEYVHRRAQRSAGAVRQCPTARVRCCLELSR
jgi:hypothetical protein